MTPYKGSQNWPGIQQKLDNIQVMGWPTRPTTIRINGVAADPATYTYVDSSKRLTLTCNLDMNEINVINFQ